jgi:hypothetical protein
MPAGQTHDPEDVNISVITKLPGTVERVQMPEKIGAVALIT